MDNNGKTIKVALYARVSTEEQKENFSLAAQLELLRKHASDSKFEIFDEYVDDGYSGTSFERPQFQRLMDDSRQDRFQFILVYKVDRFFRNNKDLLNTVDELQGCGVSVRSITEPFDTSNYLGKFVLSLFGSIAELERNTFMERSKMGKLRRAREGYYSGSSPAKFGYVYNKGTKKIEIDEKEAEAVKLMYELYNQPDSSLLKVTRKLRALGYRTKEKLLMREDVVHNILRDSIYIGKWYANRHDSKTGGLKPEEEWIEVPVPKIVSEEAFLKAQEYLNNRRNYSERNAKYKYLLQGMVKCGDCGHTIAGAADKQMQVKNGKRYGPYFKLYYRCSHFFRNKFQKVVNCRMKYIQAGKLEEAVWNTVGRIFENPYLVEQAITNGEEVKKLDKETAQKEIARISLMQESLTKEEQRILEAYRQGIISIGQLKEQMDSLRKNRENLEKTRQDLRLSLNENDRKSAVNHAVDYINKIKKGIKRFDYEQKKAVLKAFNTLVKVNINGTIGIDCFLPSIPTPSEKEFLSYFESARPISYRGYTRKCLQLHFETTLPNERQLVKTGTSRRNYTTIYANLNPDLIKKLGNFVGKEGKTESEVLRKMLDSYFKDIDKKGLPYEPLRKTSPVGLKVLPRTIRKDQGEKLRELVEKTGRKISELVRDAIESFVQ